MKTKDRRVDICTAFIGNPWDIVNLKKLLWQIIVQIPAICVTTSLRVEVVVVEVVVVVLYVEIVEVEVVAEVATCQIDKVDVVATIEERAAEVATHFLVDLIVVAVCGRGKLDNGY